MWSRKPSVALRRIVRLAAVVTVAGSVAACFQPLYSERSPTGGPGLRDAMASVDVAQITAPNGTPLSRIAVGVRNELLFGLRGGDYPAPQKYRLVINLTPTGSAVIIDPTTTRPEFGNFGLDAVYTLTDITTNKPVLNSRSFARVSYDIPGQQQRFAKARAVRDAEDQAAKVLAEQIKIRIASFLAAGT